ncbi:hypothetical protein MRX96_013283 [Rhipicephalus microplus]
MERQDPLPKWSEDVREHPMPARGCVYREIVNLYNSARQRHYKSPPRESMRGPLGEVSECVCVYGHVPASSKRTWGGLDHRCVQVKRDSLIVVAS